MAESRDSDKGFVVHVVAGDPVLARALASRLQRDIEVPVSTDHAGGVGRGSIVVTTPLECAPVRCRELVESGAAVVILAALPKRIEEDSYRQSGAREYLPMLADGSNVAEAVKGIIRSDFASRTMA